jgi:hypothetical protein
MKSVGHSQNINIIAATNDWELIAPVYLGT